MRRRRYRLVADITYAGGRLPEEVRELLAAEVRNAIGAEASDYSLAASSPGYRVVTIMVTLRGGSSLEVLTRLNEALDDTLMATGLFEEFDVSGKVLRAAPIELADRIRGTP